VEFGVEIVIILIRTSLLYSPSSVKMEVIFTETFPGSSGQMTVQDTNKLYFKEKHVRYTALQ